MVVKTLHLKTLKHSININKTKSAVLNKFKTISGLFG